MIESDYYESDLFLKAFKEMTKGMEDHEFKHYNESMGIRIHSKEHYIHEMKKRKMVPFKEMERMADKWDKDHPRKEYNHLSPKASEIIRSLKLTADKYGNLKLGTRAINALIEIGAIKPRNPILEKELKEYGYAV